ncbi:TRAP transporter substrate-binding protein [Candidatus Halocynthiibacter alkanivorans]|uniref:TRAP transporter substrate-binding protein n=1 Tax=Candidatus Halocynthiibacter alkanivorans TaxID=2267619 RepID=UPI000DF476CE|nr:TRAP transporter substrate-binding protein [Candidatus Halocynthiibacter alkanivorans]
MSIILKFGGYQGAQSVHSRGVNAFCSALKRSVGDAVTVQFTQDIVADGHKASDLLSLTESGELDACYFSSSYLVKRVPDLGLFDQHFVVPDRQQAYAVLDGALGKRLAQKVAEETGFAVLGYWDNGLRHISSARGRIRTPEDCQGLKIRTLANEDHKRIFRTLGFEPMAIDVRDLPAAVENLQVDAQENPLTNIFNFELHKTHRHITLTRHLLGVALVLFNKAAFNSWPPFVQRAVLDAVAEATEMQRGFAAEDDVRCMDAMRREGVEITELSAAERAMFVAATAGEVAVTRRGFDAGLLDLFEQDLAGAPAQAQQSATHRTGAPQ